MTNIIDFNRALSQRKHKLTPEAKRSKEQFGIQRSIQNVVALNHQAAITVCEFCDNAYETAVEAEGLGLEVVEKRCETHAAIENYFGDQEY